MKRAILILLLILVVSLLFVGCFGGGDAIKEYTITLRANPTSGGTTQGGGKVLKDELAMICAIPNDGYVFKNWTESGTVVSSNREYSFIATKNRTLVANFEEGDPVFYAVVLLSNPEGAGTFTGNGFFQAGEEATVKAVAEWGYDFVNWTLDGTEVSTDAEYSFIVTKDVELVANFEADGSPARYEITLSIDPVGWGGILGNGTYEEGELATIKAVAYEGYVFVNWTEDGEEISTAEIFEFTVTRDRHLVAHFGVDLDHAKVSLEVRPEKAGQISGGGYYEKGQEITVEALAYPGFDFLNWTINEEVISTSAQYTFTVTKEVTLVANFQDDGQPTVPGFNSYEYRKLLAFLESEHEGIKNGDRLMTNYDPLNPAFWLNVSWQRDEPRGVNRLNWQQADLHGILDLQGFASLEEINLSSTSISAIDVSDCASLKYFTCGSASLTQLNMANCTALEYFACHSSQFEELDLSNHPTIGRIDISDSELTSINVANCLSLNELSCCRNKLSHINLEGCTELKKLVCENNQLAVLDIAACTGLEELWCSANRLSSLNLLGCPNLEKLICQENQLENIVVSNFNQLQLLNISYNLFTGFEIREFPLLEQLICTANLLEELKIENHATITFINCKNNQLTSLVIDNCPSLTSLHCQENFLLFSALPLGEGLSDYKYNNQKEIPVRENNKVFVDELVDLSSEFEIDGTASKYIWYLINDNPVWPLTDYDGIFWFNSHYLGEEYYCLIRNDKFPGLIIKTVPFEVVAN